MHKRKHKADEGRSSKTVEERSSNTEEGEETKVENELKIRTCVINIRKGLALKDVDSVAFPWFLARVVGLLANASFRRDLEMEGVVIYKAKKTLHQTEIDAVESAICDPKRERTDTTAPWFAEECVSFG